MSEQHVEDGDRIPPRCFRIAQQGIRTAADCISLRHALTADLTDDRITPQVGETISNVMSKLLKGLRNDDDYEDLTKQLRSLLRVPDTR